jgi:hypothetical protein
MRHVGFGKNSTGVDRTSLLDSLVLSRRHMKSVVLLVALPWPARLLHHYRPPTSLVLTGIVTTNDVVVSPQIGGQISQLWSLKAMRSRKINGGSSRPMSSKRATTHKTRRGSRLRSSRAKRRSGISSCRRPIRFARRSHLGRD